MVRYKLYHTPKKTIRIMVMPTQVVFQEIEEYTNGARFKEIHRTNILIPQGDINNVKDRITELLRSYSLDSAESEKIVELYTKKIY